MYNNLLNKKMVSIILNKIYIKNALMSVNDVIKPKELEKLIKKMLKNVHIEK
jgi:hypothetical protein